MGPKVEAALEIFLNAIAGTSSPSMMRLIWKISGEQVVILVDLRSTHSFLDPIVARRDRLNVNKSTKLARVANGATIQSEGHCDSVLLKIQGTQLFPSLYILELKWM